MTNDEEFKTQLQHLTNDAEFKTQLQHTV